MRRTAVAVLGALVLVACGGDDEPAPVGAPVLTVRTTCYGECSYAGPIDVPDVAVYDDGTIVSYAVEDGDVVLRTGQLDDLGAALALADDAGLFEGGVAVNGSTQGTADGGGTLFTGRSGDDVTVVEAPFLGYAGDLPDAGDPARRRALEELDVLLRAAAEDGEPAPVERYADVDEVRDRCEIVGEVTTRPLLPHERDCDDVRRSLAELRLKDLRALRG